MLFVRYFPIMEDTQIKTQTPKMSINDLYFFCAQSLMATLNLLATNVTYVIQLTILFVCRLYRLTFCFLAKPL